MFWRTQPVRADNRPFPDSNCPFSKSIVIDMVKYVMVPVTTDEHFALKDERSRLLLTQTQKVGFYTV
jgi:hypothetical protein